MQDEIARLKAAIEAQGKGLKPKKARRASVGDSGGPNNPTASGEKKIVYKEVLSIKS